MPPPDDGVHLYPVWAVTVCWAQHCAGADDRYTPGAWRDVRCRRWVPPRPAMMAAALIGWPVAALGEVA